MFGKFSRRQFAKLAGLSALGDGARRARPADERRRNRSPTRTPPPVSRTASSGARRPPPIRSRARSRKTAAAARSGTRSATRRARSRIAATRDRANDHYHRYKEDVAPDQGARRQGLPFFDRMAAGVSGRHRRAEPQGPRFLRPPARRAAREWHRAVSRRSITGTCRRRCRTASADGNPAKPRKRSRIMRATSPSV